MKSWTHGMEKRRRTPLSMWKGAKIVIGMKLYSINNIYPK